MLIAGIHDVLTYVCNVTPSLPSLPLPSPPLPSLPSSHSPPLHSLSSSPLTPLPSLSSPLLSLCRYTKTYSPPTVSPCLKTQSSSTLGQLRETTPECSLRSCNRAAVRPPTVRGLAHTHTHTMQAHASMKHTQHIHTLTHTSYFC